MQIVFSCTWRARILRVAVAVLLSCHCAVGAGPAAAGSFGEVKTFGSNPGNLRMFAYVPDRVARPAPVVVVLHGCTQNATSYFEHSGWRAVADANGALLVFPEQQWGIWPFSIFPAFHRNHVRKCFNFAELRDSRRDAGEALSIRQMVTAIGSAVPADPRRIFVTGLSAGGGMTAVLLATYPDLFSAGAIIAGPPYRCGTKTITAAEDCGVTTEADPTHNPAPDRTPQDWGDRVRAAFPGFAGPWPRVAIWQGDADGTVDPLDARELVEQWTNVHGIDSVPETEAPRGPAIYQAFGDAAGRILVESYTIRGFGHATPIDPDGSGNPDGRTCGSVGDDFIRDADICSTRAIADFFGLAVPPS